MLTDKALHERKWGRFPSLDRVLGQHPVPSHHYGFTSVSDNIFSQLTRLLEVAATVQEHADVVLAVTDTKIAMRLPDDLDNLAHQLHDASRVFAMHADFVDRLRNDVQEQAFRIRCDAEPQQPNAQ
ncbi:MAG: hypothetical protein KDK97_07705 [Verrucomicrobiales bacterium]|nr:hypothetical protein [Verrucomicrobiales bacterium]MCP5560686.1 hypothetical protein [Verrucomicrobiaceae bacterium]